MKYALLIYEDEASQPADGSPESADMFQRYGSFTEDIRSAGILVGGEALHAVATATSVRVRGNRRSVTDGPFAETKEQLGGFYLIDVEDLDKAIDVASRIPGAATGCIEVRPLVEWD
jgi:hypothetical protein